MYNMLTLESLAITYLPTLQQAVITMHFKVQAINYNK